MNIALIIAGGSGTRTGNSVPKQFITVNEVPVIVYTMCNLQKVSEIDRIVVSVANGWQSFVQVYAKQYGIDKLSDIIEAGDTRHHTIYRSIRYLSDKYQQDSKILIVDANRPLIPTKVVQQSIATSCQDECTVALMPCYDTMYISRGAVAVEDQLDRSILYSGQSPECAILSDLVNVYEFANEHSIEDTTAVLYMACKKTVRMVKGSSKSFKITTQDDLDLFKALINSSKKNLEEGPYVTLH